VEIHILQSRTSALQETFHVLGAPGELGSLKHNMVPHILLHLF